MGTKRTILGALAVFGTFAMTRDVAAGELSGRDVFLRQEAARNIREVTAEASITTDAKQKTFTWWRKLGADNVHFKTLTRFHQPAEIRGEGILIDERNQNDNDVQLYLPAYKKVRRVEGQSQSTSFMGSVFSYSDIASPHVDDYKHKLLRSEPCPGDAKTSCYVLELTPAGDVVRERTGYSKSIEWVRSDNFVAIQAEFYDVGGALWKRFSANDVREVDTTAHKWLAHETRIEDVKTKRTSVLRFTQVRVNTGIPDSTFTVQNLSREP
jgi:outer membrane lipoprotein-sorting protein